MPRFSTFHRVRHDFDASLSKNDIQDDEVMLGIDARNRSEHSVCIFSACLHYFTFLENYLPLSLHA